MNEPKKPHNADYILSGTRGWIALQRCDTSLASWLQFKLSCSKKTAENAAAWAHAELKRLGEKYDRD